jgi:hypothetical protein
MLAWSFNADGQVRRGLVAERDRRMGIDSSEKRKQRQDLVPLAHAQEGAAALEGRFPGQTSMPAGIHEKDQ